MLNQRLDPFSFVGSKFQDANPDKYDGQAVSDQLRSKVLQIGALGKTSG